MEVMHLRFPCSRVELAQHAYTDQIATQVILMHLVKKKKQKLTDIIRG